MSDLTVSDIEMLSDALDVFETKELQSHDVGALMQSLLFSMVGDKDDPEFENFKVQKNLEEERKRIEIKSRQRNLKERVVLIKAKLIQMKYRCCVEELMSDKAQNVPKYNGDEGAAAHFGHLE